MKTVNRHSKKITLGENYRCSRGILEGCTLEYCRVGLNLFQRKFDQKSRNAAENCDASWCRQKVRYSNGKKANLFVRNVSSLTVYVLLS